MVVTVAVAVPTHNLAYGVAAGVLTAFVLTRVPGDSLRQALATPRRRLRREARRDRPRTPVAAETGAES